MQQHLLNEQRAELELQNEELLTAHEEMSVMKERYFDLYDSAPVGYVTVSDSGLIREANFTFVRLLGMAPGLAQQKFTSLIFGADQDIYYLCRKQLAETGKPQECELRMLKNDGAQIWVQLSVTAALAACRT